MRPLFWHYPQDKQSWACEDRGICLAKIFWWHRLCRPASVSAMSGCRRAKAGSLSTVSATPVGSISEVPAALETIPVFIREGSPLIQQLVD